MSLEALEYFFKHLVDYIQQQEKEVKPKFVLHGGEPLLLPPAYLRSFCELQQKYFDPLGIVYKNSLQTNLVRVSDATLNLLQQYQISLGVSLDVFGNQRVNIQGQNSQEQVLDNMQRLIDQNISFGAIAVLHAVNLDKVIHTYHFFNELGINYRILPIFSIQDSPQRMQPLLLNHSQVVQALQSVTLEQFQSPTQIKVYPLWDYFVAALRSLTREEVGVYNPQKREWALIINTNGDMYSHGDSYLLEGKMGNVFQQSLADIFTSSPYQETVAVRKHRSQTCRSCRFDRYCSQLPVAESFPSERYYDAFGQLQCAIASPMIEFMIAQIQQSSEVEFLLSLMKNQHIRKLDPSPVG